MRGALAILFLAACGKPPDPPASPPVPTAPAPAPLPASPSILAFSRDGNLWTLDTANGLERPVTALKDAGAAEPAWSPDRRWIAFTATVDPEANLYPRNVLVVRHDGTDLRQATPSARAGLSLEHAPKGLITGRVTRGLEPLSGATVSAYGTKRTARSGPDGRFQIFVPLGGGWVKAAAEVEGRRHVGWKLAPVKEGKSVSIGDLVLTAGAEDVLEAPAWSSDGQWILYRARHASGRVSIRRIRPDGTGDQTLAMPPAPVTAGPVGRGALVWYKTAEGKIERLDLDTRRVSHAFDAGVSIPDALALSPRGDAFATLRLDVGGRPALVLEAGAAPEVLATFAPGEPQPRSLDFSPDGSALVLDRQSPEGASDLWLFTLATRTFKRLTLDGRSSHPVWHGR